MNLFELCTLETTMIQSKISVFFTAMLSLVISTTTEKCGKSPAMETPCTHSAVVKDFAGLDGCSILLVLENGKKLLPVNLEAFTPLTDGQSIRMDYKSAEDMMSICMAEDEMVKLTCLATKIDGSWTIDCPEMIDPYRVAWAEAVMQEINPTQVDEVILDGQRAYMFYAPSGARIYNCKGDLLCSYTYNTVAACESIISKISEAKTIYVVNE
jgi:hypothetical protein